MFRIIDSKDVSREIAVTFPATSQGARLRVRVGRFIKAERGAIAS
jgi:hypothetical protein